jgi:DNA-binding transcriptional regulator YhcF (GntR family)
VGLGGTLRVPALVNRNLCAGDSETATMTIKAIENKKRKTGYADICTAVFQRICSGEWPVNRRIPSESELIAMFGASKVTAARAMQELARAGVITRVHGVGSLSHLHC